MTTKTDLLPDEDRSLRKYAFEVMENFDPKTLEHRMARHYLWLSNPENTPSTTLANQRGDEIAGIPVVLDHSVPPGEVHIKMDGKVQCKIVGIDTPQPDHDAVGDLEQAIRFCEGVSASFILGGPAHTMVIKAARAHLDRLRKEQKQ